MHSTGAKQSTPTFNIQFFQKKTELDLITIRINYLGFRSCHDTLGSPWHVVDAHSHKRAIDGSPVCTLKLNRRTLITHLRFPVLLQRFHDGTLDLLDRLPVRLVAWGRHEVDASAVSSQVHYANQSLK
jgi:hypothetical protein